VKTFYAATQAFYERDGNRRVIPNVLLIQSESQDQAGDVAGDFLDDHYPAPGYFDHAFEVKELPGIEFTEDTTLIILSVSDEYVLSSSS